MPDSKVVPNSFQTPNAYVDEAMEFLTGEEYKVLSFAARHILGWQDSVQQRQREISLSRFENGFTLPDGRHFRGTGLSRPTITKALRILEGFGLLDKIGKPTPKGQMWRIGENPNWDSLVQRALTATSKRAALVKPVNHPLVNAVNQQTDQVVKPVNQQVVKPINQGGVTPLTSASKPGLPMKTQEKTQQQIQEQTQPAAAGAADNIFVLYENAFGKPAGSPLLIDELKDIQDEFELDWIADALRETVLGGGQTIKYTRAILVRWQKEGRPKPETTTSESASDWATRFKNSKYADYIYSGQSSPEVNDDHSAGLDGHPENVGTDADQRDTVVSEGPGAGAEDRGGPLQGDSARHAGQGEPVALLPSGHPSSGLEDHCAAQRRTEYR